ncbi:MAG: hypothetical protein AAF253_10155 [Pseudomonadota bacterium]
MAVMVLTAWSPELRDRNVAGQHPYSTSAIGYGGFVRLLEARGDPVSVSRFDRFLPEYTDTLKVVTLAPVGMDKALEELELQGLALVVLPKRVGNPDRENPKWQRDVWIPSAEQIAALLEPFDDEAEVWRVRAPAEFATDFGFFRPGFDEDIQLIRSDRLEPVVATAGGMFLAKVPDQEIYILSEPDLINTVGLAGLGRAEMATAMVDWLRYDDRETPIVFDATLHGFEQARSVLQMMFDIPFLGATLVGLAVFLMFGWAGAVRFGAPVRAERAIALGKEALTDSTAGLITMTHREPRLAPGYLALTKRAAARAIAAPRTLTDDQLNDLLDRMGPGGKNGFTALADAAANPATSREDLLIKARRLFQWRKDITHGQ